MPMSPEKIKMFSLTESGSDLAFFSPDLGQNEEEVRSKEKSPVVPASPFDENPEPSPNQEAHFKEKLPDEENHNLCANQIKGPVENPNPRTNLKEPVEGHLQMPAIFSDNQSHGIEKRVSFSHVEGGAERVTGKEKVIPAASAVLRKLPDWASNQSAEDEKGRRGKSKIQTENKGTDFPLARNLQEVIEAFSGDFNEKKYANMDILEVAEMKGIVFENPSWWPPEGFPDSL
ncbi:hypothetical protein FCM35_KLT15814 [Carex littledalei]|uniref:Uncharacterized protein n=1 Tax=Carex littledalei TaxID=544730 RepID=A0A833RSE7_9POAL|nr:hypothetical protein FCM35_KLT15814 [Carex littledalei]